VGLLLFGSLIENWQFFQDSHELRMGGTLDSQMCLIRGIGVVFVILKIKRKTAP
jgi:hypothetical protein